MFKPSKLRKKETEKRKIKTQPIQQEINKNQMINKKNKKILRNKLARTRNKAIKINCKKTLTKKYKIATHLINNLKNSKKLIKNQLKKNKKLNQQKNIRKVKINLMTMMLSCPWFKIETRKIPMKLNIKSQKKIKIKNKKFLKPNKQKKS